jgi:hypothetical protein
MVDLSKKQNHGSQRRVTIRTKILSSSRNENFLTGRTSVYESVASKAKLPLSFKPKIQELHCTPRRVRISCIFRPQYALRNSCSCHGSGLADPEQQAQLTLHLEAIERALLLFLACVQLPHPLLQRLSCPFRADTHLALLFYGLQARA